jgi:hypothetical protein
MSALGEHGAWRVVKSVTNEQRKYMEVSKKRRTVTMRYTVRTEPEIKELEIGMEGTVRRIPGKLKIEEHVVVDGKGAHFPEQDHLFTYLSKENPIPLRILKATKTLYPKPGPIEAVKDMREGIRITFGDRSWRGQKSDGVNYRLIFERAQAELKVEGWWRVNQVRQEGSVITVEATRKPDDQPPTDADWEDMMRWPPLGTVGEAIRRAIRRAIRTTGERETQPQPESVPLKVNTSPGKVEANFVYQTWDNRHLSVDLKVGRGEPMGSVWPCLRQAIGEEIEPIEEYHAWHRNAEAQLPWEEGKRYELIPNAEPPEPTECV